MDVDELRKVDTSTQSQAFQEKLNRALPRRFVDLICVVTGAGQGIGRAVAKRLAAEGGLVIVGERSAETAVETVEQITQAGGQAMGSIVDLLSLAEADRLMNDAVCAYGRIDVLVNVVGGTIWWQPFHLCNEEQIRHEMDRSLFSTLWCCKAALPHMIAQGGGAIVNFGSQVTQGGKYRGPYSAAKGAITTLTKNLAQEYGAFGIRVNAVAPGSTFSDDQKTSRMLIQPGMIASPSEHHDAYFRENAQSKRRAIDRPGLPEEQAAAVAFLASFKAAYITGQTISCDGGAL